MDKQDTKQDTWWNYQGATPTEQVFAMPPPRRGEQRGACANARCRTLDAVWFNTRSSLYYCDECARHINERCLALGTRKLCVLHA